jgi:urease accessory protein
MGTTTITGTAMGTELDAAQATRLAAWLSPSFPIGAYAYSHGLERAVETGVVDGEAALRGWLAELLGFGSARSEAILFARAFDAAGDRARLLEIGGLAQALRPSAELALETSAQGAAFLAAVAAAWPDAGLDAIAAWHADDGVTLSLPVAAGAACAVHGLPRAPALALYLHAFVANLVSAGVRLIPPCSRRRRKPKPRPSKTWAPRARWRRSSPCSTRPSTPGCSARERE